MDGGKKHLTGEYGQGDSIGVVEALTHQPGAATVHAVRESELARLPEGALRFTKHKFSQVVTRVIHPLGEKILGSLQQEGHPRELHSSSSKWDAGNPASNLSTAALMVVSEEVPLTAFTQELKHALKHALSAVGPALLLTNGNIKQRLGSAVLDSIHGSQPTSWLGQQENIHPIIPYQADSTLTPRTQRCIQQADCILMVGLGDQEPTVGELEAPLQPICTMLLHSWARQASDTAAELLSHSHLFSNTITFLPQTVTREYSHLLELDCAKREGNPNTKPKPALLKVYW